MYYVASNIKLLLKNGYELNFCDEIFKKSNIDTTSKQILYSIGNLSFNCSLENNSTNLLFENIGEEIIDNVMINDLYEAQAFDYCNIGIRLYLLDTNFNKASNNITSYNGTINKVVKTDSTIQLSINHNLNSLEDDIKLPIYTKSCSFTFCDKLCGLDIDDQMSDKYSCYFSEVDSNNMVATNFITLNGSIDDYSVYKNGSIYFDMLTENEIVPESYLISTKKFAITEIKKITDSQYTIRFITKYTGKINNNWLDSDSKLKVKLIKGCKKTYATCLNKDNFGGFPDIPTKEATT